ncbi:hypothetical protein GGS24DRAFT_511390 [Hypoxylon argillaceum]|nr:hypothetical protein GGS24DRAFT_511390 [Hypoxylon argillaceum]
MSFFESPRVITLTDVLEHVSVQLDGVNFVIKLPYKMFNILSIEEQYIVKHKTGMTLGLPVEFYLDSRNFNRVYLANLASINLHWPVEPRVMHGFNLLVLFPVNPHPVPPPYFAPPAIPAFTFSPPPGAPRMPLQGLGSLLPAPELRRDKRGVNGFTHFRASRAAGVAKQNPGMSARDISIKLANDWKTLSLEQQAHWNVLAKSQTQRRDNKTSSSSPSSSPSPENGSGHQRSDQNSSPSADKATAPSVKSTQAQGEEARDLQQSLGDEPLISYEDPTLSSEIEWKDFDLDLFGIC